MGAIANFHAKALRQTENAELYLVYDKVPERATAFAQKNNCRMALDFNEFLNSDIEAVIIATLSICSPPKS